MKDARGFWQAFQACINPISPAWPPRKCVPIGVTQVIGPVLVVNFSGGALPAIEATIETDLRVAEWASDDVYAEFLMDEVLRGDFEARQEALNKATHMTIAEKRRIENLPFIEGTDRIFLNTATMPLDAIDAQAAAIAAQTVASVDPLADVIPLAAARSVMGRLSWQASLSEVDPAVLVAGLNGTAGVVLKALDDEVTAGGDIAGLRQRIRAMAAMEVTP